jgi:glycerophosphoryl diester phosphodiesterase
MVRPYHQFKYNPVVGDDFTVIAHRGASAYYPENTLVSFEGAIALGADMVELDVQLSLDGKVVVFHDEKIFRCTNGRGKIAEHTLAELKKLDAGSWFNKKFQGEKIPTLSEVLNVCKNRIAVNIEIKTEAVTGTLAGGVEEKCLQIVDQIGMRRHVVFSSFDPRAIIHLKEIDQTVAAAVLFEKGLYGSKLPSQVVASLGAAAFNCSKRELSRKWLDDLKLHDVPVNVYTVDNDNDMRRWLGLGVGGIFTNHPDILKSVLEDFRCQQRISNNRL